jgi:hypothetical protein
MRLPKTFTMTRTGGYYWRARAFRIAIAYTSLPIVLIVLGLATINPFWFRENFFNWATECLNRFTCWINYRQYSIYLGMDPRVWHALKGDVK